MLGRRRQSIHGSLPTFGRAPSPSKGGFVPFGRPDRSSASRDGRPSPSPRASSNNLRESPSRDNRLSSLAESPPNLSPTAPTNGTNGVTAQSAHITDSLPQRPKTSGANGSGDMSDMSQIMPPPGPPPSHLKEVSKDSEGFNVPAPQNDPISQAQAEAAQEIEQPQFKLDIRPDPIQEQDADAKAALSNVANTLRSSQMITPNRKLGTVRGRRDVRNTIFVPSNSTMPTSESFNIPTTENPPPPSPSLMPGRSAALAALSNSDHRAAPSVSDTTSIRSGHSLTNHASVKHAEMHHLGLNASIIETVSATFENGVIKTSKISGEIALVYNKSNDDDAPLAPGM
jgi:hypothetical protein